LCVRQNPFRVPEIKQAFGPGVLRRSKLLNAFGVPSLATLENYELTLKFMKFVNRVEVF